MATFGEATFIVELLDAETGDVLAVASERRKIEQPGGRIDQFTMRTTSATVYAQVRRWASQAASKLRSEIDKGMKKARQQ
jgi:pantothenate kinase-related protein Tda10